jgi:hypothetical protein
LRNIWIAVRTTPLPLGMIALGLLTYLIANIYWFDSMPEIFSRAYEVGRLFQNLSEATLAAFIFFIFSFQLPFVIQQRRVGPQVMHLLGNVIDLVVNPIRRIYETAGPIEKRGSDTRLYYADVTEELIAKYFERIASANVAHWLDSFTDSEEKCQANIVQLWRYSQFIDSEMLSILSQLEMSEYMKSLPLYRGVVRPDSHNNSLRFLVTPYYWQFKLAMDLLKLGRKLEARYKMPSIYAVDQK